jgi:DNA-binding response OmpR family regulator
MFDASVSTPCVLGHVHRAAWDRKRDEAMAVLSVGMLETDPNQADRMHGFLVAQGLAVDSYRDTEALIASLPMRPPQMLLIGAGRESSTTLALLREIRDRSRVPAMVLGAADDISQVAILEAGADDVLPRSVPLRALIARMRTILRRAEWGMATPPSITTVNGWRLVAERRQLLRPDDSECHLTTAEFDLLQLLLESRGQAVSRDAVAERVFRRPFRAEDRTVDNLVLRLRRKLGPEQQEAIKTVRGAGYMFAGFAEESLRVA